MKLLFYLLFAAVVGLLAWKRRAFIFLLLPFNIIMDMSFNYFETLSLVTYFRALVLLTVIVLYFRSFYKYRFFRPLYLFLAYALILLPFTDNFFYSFKFYTQVFLTMMMFPVGYVAINSLRKMEQLNKSMIFIIIISAIVTIAGYAFGIGFSFDYSEEEGAVGLLGSAGLYAAGLAIVALPVIIPDYTKNRKFMLATIYLFALIDFILILLNVRRTAILIPMVGLLTYFVFSPRKGYLLIGLVVSLGILILITPIYKSTFMRRFEIRQEEGRFEKDFYENESRYLFTQEIFREVFSFKDPQKSIFGKDIFGSSWEGEERADRMLHADHNVLLDGAGIVGFLLYLYFYVEVIRMIRRKVPTRNPRILRYRSLAWSLIAVSVMVSLNGSLSLVSYRAILFLYLGASIGLYRNLVPDKEPATKKRRGLRVKEPAGQVAVSTAE
jgi:hypothetical protein